MIEITRRALLCLSALSPLIVPLSAFAARGERNRPAAAYLRTTAILQDSYRIERIAEKSYVGFTAKALSEGYPNIAYLFHSFSHSEKIHAENYLRILRTIGSEAKPVHVEIEVGDTKANTQTAARNELRKIQTTYPGFLRELETESHEESVVSCMYSWKSHRQHEEKVKEIDQYAGFFFSAVSSRIEGLHFDFHVCGVCGSTIDRAPVMPCVICNRPKSNYRSIGRPG